MRKSAGRATTSACGRNKSSVKCRYHDGRAVETGLRHRRQIDGLRIQSRVHGHQPFRKSADQHVRAAVRGESPQPGAAAAFKGETDIHGLRGKVWPSEIKTEDRTTMGADEAIQISIEAVVAT